MAKRRICARALTAVCFEVSASAMDAKDAGWVPGPFPWRLPDGQLADAAARGTYFNPRAAKALYGGAGSRWHRATLDSDAIRGAELLLIPRYDMRDTVPDGRRFLAVIHRDLPGTDPVRELESAVNLEPRQAKGRITRESYIAALGPGIAIPGSVRRAFAVSMATFPAGHHPALADAPGSWEPVTSWLWALAAATPFREFCPDTDDPGLLAGLVYLSSSWRGLALRDGVSFVGLTADPPAPDPPATADPRTTADPPARERSFFDWGEVYVRSLYCDIALLAALQRDALNGFADRLAAIGNRFDRSAELKRLVNEVTEFRNLLWWEDVGYHSIGNQLLRRLQEAHGAPELFSRIVSDLDAFRHQVDTRAIEAAAEAQRSEELRAKRFEHAASIAATAFALPALIFAALALPIAGLTTIPAKAVVAIGVGTAVAGALIGALGSSRIRRFRRTGKAPER